MKTLSFGLFLIILSVLSVDTTYASDKFKLEDFAMRLEQSTALPHRI
ncbi:hypothetical protein EZS27_033654 [termite gut metagenome]|uniref:Uncharacterized protein n=1 Tax=termite gut metagenome TaxID=433724 RepID=A0A5J4Q2S0_9ZZZZ